MPNAGLNQIGSPLFTGGAGSGESEIRLGDKRREIPLERSQDILKILADFRDGGSRAVVKDGKTEDVVVSRIFPTTHFGFRKITVARPLRLNFRASAERIARLEEEKGLQALALSKKGAPGVEEQAEGRALDSALKRAGTKLAAPARKAVLSALSERDETAAICLDKDGSPEPDPELRDTESVPFAETVEAFFDREVKPHVPDAWIDPNKRDPKDGQAGLVGLRSTSTATSIATRRLGRWKRSRPTSGPSRATSCGCSRKSRARPGCEANCRHISASADVLCQRACSSQALSRHRPAVEVQAAWYF